MKYYAECILPVPLAQVFTYALTDEQSERACFGMRAIVPFGKTHKYTGIIIGITESAPEGFEIKEVLDLPDETPIIHVPQYELWKWIADYYMCPIGDVMKAALPSELKPEAGKNGVIREDFRPKCKSFIEVSLPFFSEISERNRKVAETLTLLKRAAKQQELFMKLLEMSHYLEEKKERAENVEQQKENGLVAQDELLKAANSTSSILKELIKRGLCRQKEIEIARLDFNEDKDIKTEPPFPLTEIQDEAFREICNSFKDKDVTLLHGVTSSGKTEIYIHLIQEVISSHKQALMMVPEIALTTQLCMRLQRVFGKRMLVYHSKLSNANRVEIWNKILKDDSIDLIVGVRSSIFLPFRELGLIIVDEEHETSYKQQDPAPRYHAREAAIILARKHGAKVLLGSATPSLETYYLAKQERFGYVRLSERHAGVSMPRISLISLREARKAESMMGTFTQNLIKAINQTILSGKQVILFQNRRGFSPNIECTVCGWSPRCPRCDVSLTFHKKTSSLRCHYCGYQQGWPKKCPDCGFEKFSKIGFGTERIEDDIQRLIPLAKPLRVDTDTTSSKTSYEKFIEDFDTKQKNILIGTQMVSKGLDFGGVDTVGILSADALMNIPDFRSHERAFQLMEQVSGRAGRRVGQSGEVLIQCNNIKHPLLQQVVNHDYEAMAEMQLADRKRYFYPPFSRLIIIYIKGRYEDRIEAFAQKYASVLRSSFGERVLGPEVPGVAWIKNMHIRQIMLKIEREASVGSVRQILRAIQEKMMQENQEFSRIVFYYDVDPM